MKQPSHKPKAKFQDGLSLIELMISITIGLLILASLSTLFINQSRTRVELDKSNRMIDNGRYAMELLSGNLRLAGYYDNYSPYPIITMPTALYDPCDVTSLVSSALNSDILSVPVQGYDATLSGATSQITSPPCSLTYATGTDHALQPGSDILVVRRASTAVAASPINGRVYLQVSMCQTDTAVPPNNYQVASAPAAVGVSFTNMHKRNCTNAGALPGDGYADLREFMVLTYFVSPYNKVGDGIPTLKQIDQYNNVTPLVEGIEYMQVDYGIDGDTNGDGITDTNLTGKPSSYLTTCPSTNVGCWTNVVAVRINIVARNSEATTGWSDSKTYSLGLAGSVGPFNAAPYNTGPNPKLENYKRHAYTQVIRLVNPASRRDTP